MVCCKPTDFKLACVVQVPMHNQDGVWTAMVDGLPKKGILYAYRVDGPGGWETGYR